MLVVCSQAKLNFCNLQVQSGLLFVNSRPKRNDFDILIILFTQKKKD